MVRNFIYLHPVRDASLGRRNEITRILAASRRDASLRDANVACRLHFLPRETFLTECHLTVIKIYISRPLVFSFQNY